MSVSTQHLQQVAERGAAELGDYVDRAVRRFLAQRTDGERFAQWVTRAAEEDLK